MVQQPMSPSVTATCRARLGVERRCQVFPWQHPLRPVLQCGSAPEPHLCWPPQSSAQRAQAVSPLGARFHLCGRTLSRLYVTISDTPVGILAASVALEKCPFKVQSHPCGCASCFGSLLRKGQNRACARKRARPLAYTSAGPSPEPLAATRRGRSRHMDCRQACRATPSFETCTVSHRCQSLPIQAGRCVKCQHNLGPACCSRTQDSLLEAAVG